MAMKKWFAGLTLALLGSVVPAQGIDYGPNTYSLIAEHLYQTGSIFTFYQIIDFAPTWKILPNILRSEAINYADALSGQEAGPELLSVFDTIENKIIPELQLKRIAGSGISQTYNGQLPDGTNLYKTKQFILVDQSDGMLPLLDIVNGQSFAFSELHRFPETTLTAVTFSLNIEKAVKLFLPYTLSFVDNPEEIQKTFEEPIAELDNLSLNDLFKHFSGQMEYCMATVPSKIEGKDTLAYMFSCPDPKGKIFSLIKAELEKEEKENPTEQKLYTITDNSITFQLPFPSEILPFELIPEIYSADGRLQFASTTSYRALVESGSSLANSPDFQAFSKKLPETGIVLSYVSPNASAALADVVNNIPGVDFSGGMLASLESPLHKIGFASVSNIVKDGILTEMNTTIDGGTMQVLGQAALQFYTMAQPFILDKLSEKAVENDDASFLAQDLEVENDYASFLAKDLEMDAIYESMFVFSDALAKYAAENNNAYPESLEAFLEAYPAIWTEMTNSNMPENYTIGYFPGMTPADGNKPVMYLLTEDGYLVVCFADGRVSEWNYEMSTSSAKGVVSFLQTQEEYSEEVLNELVILAEAIKPFSVTTAGAQEKTAIPDEKEAPAEEGTAK